jgi:Fic family protein
MSTVNWQDEEFNISVDNKNKIDSLYYAKIIIPTLTKDDIIFLKQKLIKYSKKDFKNLVLDLDINNYIVSLSAQGSLEIETNTTKVEFNQIIQNSVIEKNISKQKILEVNNLYFLTKKIIKDALANKALNIDTIKNWHYILMQGIRQDAGEFSKYKRIIPNINIALTHPKNIKEELGIWLDKYKNIQNIEQVASAHIDFELIHPFGDGNGRIGRLIMIHQLTSLGYLPPLINNASKIFYYESLNFALQSSNLSIQYFIIYSVLNMQKNIIL